jgi:hypothetical protein
MAASLRPFLLALFLSTFLICNLGLAQADDIGTFDLSSEVSKFKQRYPMKSTSGKLINNRGRGRSELYGTRNFRVVLHGVLYRGGANNKYLQNPRKNMNPLPSVGLKNLCKEDFSTAIYMYSQNFSRAPKEVSCSPRNAALASHTLKYKQYSPLSQEKTILKSIYNRIKGQLDGPIYVHCWNGWHASGLISGIALKQFCDWNSSEVLAYWRKNTDGNSRGHSTVKRKLRHFQPYKEYAISKREKALICPQKIGVNADVADDVVGAEE